jgi:hypothetical protein
MEIEIPYQLVRAGLWMLLIITPLLVGMRAYPTTTEYHPLLTTSHLAHLHDYRQEVTGWVRTFHQFDHALIELMEEPSAELLI